MSTLHPRPVGDTNAIFGAAIAISIALHAIALAVHFSPFDPLKLRAADSALEVVLVNAKSQAKPVKPTAIAQADLNGGGEHDEGHATSFLPASPQNEDGDVLEQSQAAVARLEAEQKKLMSSLKPSSVVAPDPSPNHDAETREEVSDDPAALERSIARMQAQVDKQINDYNARPRRGFIGPQTLGATYAMYYSQWKDKVLRVGASHYPPEIRGHLYGDLILQVTLNPDGTIYNDEVNITRSSGNAIMDRAAKRLVRMAAPFGKFPPDMRRDYDVFEVITKVSFTKGDAFEARIEKR